MKWKTIILFLVSLLFSAILYAGDGMSARELMTVFSTYESLNRKLLATVGTDSNASIRQEVERYTEGPFNQALECSVQIVCANEDAYILHALFQTTLATSNAASERTALALGQIFMCKPAFFEKEFKFLKKMQQVLLHETLIFGFENVVYDQRNESEVNSLRNQLQSLTKTELY